MQTPIVGTIVALTGSATQVVEGKSLPVELDGPVYKGAVLVTDAGSHLEVRFSDETMLSQGQNSEISIDNYVFSDDPQVASSILLNLTAGTLRTITGKIAEENPEKFEIKSPLTTLGIRGTDLTLKSSPGEGDLVILNQIGPNHLLVIRNLEGGARFLNKAGTSVAVKDGFTFGSVTTLDHTQLQNLLKITPFSSLLNDGFSEPEDKGKKDHEDELTPDSADQDDGADQDDPDVTEALAAGDFSILDRLAETAAGGEMPQGAANLGLEIPLPLGWHLYDPVSSQFSKYGFQLAGYSSDSEAELLSIIAQKSLPPEPIPQTPSNGEQPQEFSAFEPVLIPTGPDLQPVTETAGPPPAAAPPPILITGSDGDDVLIGNDQDNIFYGGGGSDQQFGVGGDDSFVIWGEFGENYYIIEDEAGNFLGGGNLISNLPDSLINGGDGFDTLIIYGNANFTGVEVISIEGVEIHSVVTFKPEQFDGIISLVGIDPPDVAVPEGHTVWFTTNGGPDAEINLSEIDEITNISSIGLGAGVTAIVDADTMLALNNTGIGPAGDSIVGIIVGVDTSYGTLITPAGTDFSDFVAAYGNDIADGIILGRAPIPVDDYASTDEDTEVFIDVLANDSDPDLGDILVIDSFSQGSDGAVNIADGILTYTPDENFSGSDSFTYTVIDRGGQSTTANVNIVINPVDDCPRVTQITYTGLDGKVQTAEVDKNTGVTVATLYGILIFHQDGSYEYTSNFDFTNSGDITLDISNPDLKIYAFDFADPYTTDLGILDLSDPDGKLSYQPGKGIGVEGGSPGSDEINHNSLSNQTQALAIQFTEGPVERATIDVTWLFKDEGPDNSSESGYWEAFDQNGNPVGEGYINENTVDYDGGSNHIASLTIEGDELFETLVFTATPYIGENNQEMTKFSDSSDYYVRDIGWEAPEQIHEQVVVTLEDVEDGISQLTLDFEVDDNNTLSGDVSPPPVITIQSFNAGSLLVAGETTGPADPADTADPEGSVLLTSVQPAENNAAPAMQLFGDPPESAPTALASIDSEVLENIDEGSEEGFSLPLFGDLPTSAETMPVANSTPPEAGPPPFGDGSEAGDPDSTIFPVAQFEPLIADATPLDTLMDVIDSGLDSMLPIVEDTQGDAPVILISEGEEGGLFS